jgi:hypothetical protein
MNTYKPNNYNSLSPYLVVNNAQKLVDLLTVIFDVKTLRRFENENGKIAHIELQLDDTVIDRNLVWKLIEMKRNLGNASTVVDDEAFTALGQRGLFNKLLVVCFETRYAVACLLYKGVVIIFFEAHNFSWFK